MKSATRRVLLPAFLLLAGVAVARAATLFEETLSTHTTFPATPSSLLWANKPAGCILKNPDIFSDGSASIQMAGVSRYLRSVPIAGLPDVSTLSFRYHEPSTATHSLKIGWVKSGQSDLNSTGTFLRLELLQGNALLSAINGTTVTTVGTTAYGRDRELVVVLVLNLGSATIPDYSGGRSLPGTSADLWFVDPAANTATHAMTISLVGAQGIPDQICFRTFSSDTGALAFLDDIRVATGAVLPDSTAPAADGFIHPGIFQTQAALELMRDRIHSPDPHPMKDGWAVLLSDPRASLSYTPLAYAHVDFAPSGTTASETRIRDDAHAAYAHALQWVVTGNPAHAAKARQILDLWASTLQSFSSTGSPVTQTELECAWLVPIFAAAAEIIRHFDAGSGGWASADIQRFGDFLNFLADEAAKSVDRDNNWGASAILSELSRAVFNGERPKYDAALLKWRTRLANILPLNLGQTLEITRDNYHVQYSLMAFVQGAEIARRQGDDLYGTLLDGQTTPRLALALEYFSGLFLGETPSPSPDISYLNAGVGFTAYEMALTHYAFRSGLPMPGFAGFVETQIRPDPRYMLFASWSTLTHAEPIVISALAAPTGLSALPSPGTIALQWADRAGAEIGYEIQRRTGAGPWGTLAIPAANAVQHSDGTVEPATEYSYRIRALGAGGDLGDWSQGVVVISDGEILTPSAAGIVIPANEAHPGSVTIRNPASVPQTFVIYPPASASNYPARLSTQSGGPSYVWDGIAGTSGAVAAPSGDEAYATANLGFAFPFFGQNRTSVRICTNGFVTFGPDTNTRPFNQNIPDAINAPPDSIFLFWSDMLTEDDGRIWYRSIDEDGDSQSDVFVVEYDRVRLFGKVDRVSAQLRLRRDGRIFMYYRNIPSGSIRYTVGLQNASGTVASRVAYANFIGEVTGTPVVSGMAARFDPPLTWLTAPLTTLGPVAPGGTARFLLNFDTSGLASGNAYTAEVVIEGSAPHQPATTLPVSLSVGTPSAYQSWKLNTALDALASDEADPDSDGLSNLLEYSMGGDPNSSVSRPGPESQMDNLKLQISFFRARADLAYIVQGSADLVTWTDLSTNPGTIGQNVLFTDTTDLALNPRRFLRLQIRLP